MQRKPTKSLPGRAVGRGQLPSTTVSHRLHQGCRAFGRAEELLRPVVAELPHEVPQPEHELEQLVYGGSPGGS